MVSHCRFRFADDCDCTKLTCRHNVELRYPSRPGVLSLAGVSIHMERGKSYAFCGTSGAGKSSILAVLQRFYNITSGSITLDGKDIRAMDVKEYRNMMGYVSQEPVLFEETIRWNLLVCPVCTHEDVDFDELGGSDQPRDYHSGGYGIRM